MTHFKGLKTFQTNINRQRVQNILDSAWRLKVSINLYFVLEGDINDFTVKGSLTGLQLQTEDDAWSRASRYSLNDLAVFHIQLINNSAFKIRY